MAKTEAILGGINNLHYSYLPSTSPGQDNSQRWKEVEKQGQDIRQGREKEKTQGWIKEQGWEFQHQS